MDTVRNRPAVQSAPPVQDAARAVGTGVPAEVEREILRAVAGIEFGSVEVIVHNARVVQIEVRTKKRFDGDIKPTR